MAALGPEVGELIDEVLRDPQRRALLAQYEQDPEFRQGYDDFLNDSNRGAGYWKGFTREALAQRFDQLGNQYGVCSDVVRNNWRAFMDPGDFITFLALGGPAAIDNEVRGFARAFASVPAANVQFTTGAAAAAPGAFERLIAGLPPGAPPAPGAAVVPPPLAPQPLAPLTPGAGLPEELFEFGEPPEGVALAETQEGFEPVPLPLPLPPQEQTPAAPTPLPLPATPQPVPTPPGPGLRMTQATPESIINRQRRYEPSYPQLPPAGTPRPPEKQPPAAPPVAPSPLPIPPRAVPPVTAEAPLGITVDDLLQAAEETLPALAAAEQQLANEQQTVAQEIQQIQAEVEQSEAEGPAASPEQQDEIIAAARDRADRLEELQRQNADLDRQRAQVTQQANEVEADIADALLRAAEQQRERRGGAPIPERPAAPGTPQPARPRPARPPRPSRVAPSQGPQLFSELAVNLGNPLDAREVERRYNIILGQGLVNSQAEFDKQLGKLRDASTQFLDLKRFYDALPQDTPLREIMLGAVRRVPLVAEYLLNQASLKDLLDAVAESNAERAGVNQQRRDRRAYRTARILWEEKRPELLARYTYTVTRFVAGLFDKIPADQARATLQYVTQEVPQVAQTLWDEGDWVLAEAEFGRTPQEPGQGPVQPPPRPPGAGGASGGGFEEGPGGEEEGAAPPSPEMGGGGAAFSPAGGEGGAAEAAAALAALQATPMAVEATEAGAGGPSLLPPPLGVSPAASAISRPGTPVPPAAAAGLPAQAITPPQLLEFFPPAQESAIGEFLYNPVVLGANYPPGVVGADGAAFIHPRGQAGPNWEVARLQGNIGQQTARSFRWSRELRMALSTYIGRPLEQPADLQNLYLQLSSSYSQLSSPYYVDHGWKVLANLAAQTPSCQGAAPPSTPVELLRSLFCAALARNGMQILRVSSEDPGFQAWKRTPAFDRLQGPGAETRVYMLCGALPRGEGEYTVQLVVGQEIARTLLNEQQDASEGRTTYVATRTDGEQDFIGFLVTRDYRTLPAFYAANPDANRQAFRLEENRTALVDQGMSDFPRMQENRDFINGADTPAAGPGGANRLLNSLEMEFLCARGLTRYRPAAPTTPVRGGGARRRSQQQAPEEQFVDILGRWPTPNGYQYRIMTRDGEQLVVPESQIVRDDSAPHYVGYLLMLYAFIDNIENGYYGTIISVANVISETTALAGPGFEAQGGLAPPFLAPENETIAQQRARQELLGLSRTDSDVASRYHRWFQYERTFRDADMDVSLGRLWFYNNGNVYNLRTVRGAGRNALPANSPMYRPYPTLQQLATYMGQAGAMLALPGEIPPEQTAAA